jgi:hypothetical protein
MNQNLNDVINESQTLLEIHAFFPPTPIKTSDAFTFVSSVDSIL